MKNIAIIIDAWATNNLLADRDIPVRIIDLISQNQTIDSVILASYDIANEFISQTIWYTNFKKFNLSDLFTNTDFIDDLKNNFTHPKFVGKLSYLEHQTHPQILNKIWSDKFQIAVFHPCQLNLDSIKNVYFFGMAWDICVMSRPLGWRWWIDFTDKNLFVYGKGVGWDNKDIDKTMWLEQEEELYQFARTSK